METALDTSTARARLSLRLTAAGLGGFILPDETPGSTGWVEHVHLGKGIIRHFEPEELPEVTASELDTNDLTQVMQRFRRIKLIQEFLIRLKRRTIAEGFPSRDVADRVENVWREAKETYGNSLPLPSMALGEDGGVLFVWRRDPHYLEIEVLPGGSEVFYENTQIGVAHHQDVSSGHSEVECAEPWFLRFIDQQAGAYGTAT